MFSFLLIKILIICPPAASSHIQLSAVRMNHSLSQPVLRFQSTSKLLTQILHILCCRAPCWLADVISGSGVIWPERESRLQSCEATAVFSRDGGGNSKRRLGVRLHSSPLTIKSTGSQGPPGTLLIWAPCSQSEGSSSTLLYDARQKMRH